MWSGDLILFTIYQNLIENRILDIQDKIQILHHSCHNGTRHEDDNTNRIRSISFGVNVPTSTYIGRLNMAIKKAKPREVIKSYSSRFKVAKLENTTNVSTCKPFLTGQSFETIRFDDYGIREYLGVPFRVIDSTKKNALVLNGPLGSISKSYPDRFSIPCNEKIKKIHLLGCTGGWGFQGEKCPGAYNDNVVAVRVVVNYTKDLHDSYDLINGVHITDFYFPFAIIEGSHLIDSSIENCPIRCLCIELPEERKVLNIVFEKPADVPTCPIFFGITFESNSEKGDPIIVEEKI
jgi:hypothetical protein